MKNNIITIALIVIAILALYFMRFEYSSYSLDKSIKACIIAESKKSKTNSIEYIKNFCEDEIKKKINQ